MGEAAQKEQQQFDGRQQLDQIRNQLCSKMRGNDLIVDFTLACFLARGHLLLEGPPGTGKTSLAKAMAGCFRASFSRIQLTSDLLPSDVVGILRLRPGTTEFEFRQGPIFANFLLADELNRTSPKTQSALLEAMAEGTVTVDGKTYPLPEPFFVIATQNPHEFQGVYPLAESQLDRFMLQLVVDSPAREDEMRIYEEALHAGGESRLSPNPNSTNLIQETETLFEAADHVHIERSVLEYSADLVRATRSRAEVGYGVSVRGGLQLIACAKALAFVRGRQYVLPKDVSDLAVPALAHRLCFVDGEVEYGRRKELIQQIQEQVRPPK